MSMHSAIQKTASNVNSNQTGGFIPFHQQGRYRQTMECATASAVSGNVFFR